MKPFTLTATLLILCTTSLAAITTPNPSFKSKSELKSNVLETRDLHGASVDATIGIEAHKHEDPNTRHIERRQYRGSGYIPHSPHPSYSHIHAAYHSMANASYHRPSFVDLMRHRAAQRAAAMRHAALVAAHLSRHRGFRGSGSNMKGRGNASKKSKKRKQSYNPSGVRKKSTRRRKQNTRSMNQRG